MMDHIQGVLNYLAGGLTLFDELWATAAANFEWFKEHSRAHYTSYQDIHDLDLSFMAGILAWGVFSFFIGLLITLYKNKRLAEQNSNFYYFRQLLALYKKYRSSELNLFQNESDEFLDFLRLLTYFEDPNLNPLILRLRKWFRRKIYTVYKKEKKRLIDTICISEGRHISESEFIQEQFCYILDYVRKVLSQTSGNHYELDSEKLCIRIKFDRNVDLESDKKFTRVFERLTYSFAERFFYKLYRFYIASWEELEKASFIYWNFFALNAIIPLVFVSATVPLMPIIASYLFFLLYATCRAYAVDALQMQRELEEAKRIETQKHAILLTIMMQCKLQNNENQNCISVANLMDEVKKASLAHRKLRLAFAVILGLARGFLAAFFIAWMCGDVVKACVGPALFALPGAAASLFIGTVVAGFMMGVYFAYKNYQQRKIELKQAEQQLESLECDIEKTSDYRDKLMYGSASLKEVHCALRRCKEEGKRTGFSQVWRCAKQILQRSENLFGASSTASVIMRVVAVPAIGFFIVVTGSVSGGWPIFFVGLCVFALILTLSRYFEYSWNSEAKQAECVMGALNVHVKMKESELQRDQFLSLKENQLRADAKKIDKKIETKLILIQKKEDRINNNSNDEKSISFCGSPNFLNSWPKNALYNDNEKTDQIAPSLQYNSAKSL